jgi:hypothetical protein
VCPLLIGLTPAAAVEIAPPPGGDQGAVTGVAGAVSDARTAFKRRKEIRDGPQE